MTLVPDIQYGLFSQRDVEILGYVPSVLLVRSHTK